jgi:hypothetical protein
MPIKVRRLNSPAVFVVTAESVQRLSEDHVESPLQRIAHHCLEARPEQGCAGNRVVAVFLVDFPALFARE